MGSVCESLCGPRMNLWTRSKQKHRKLVQLHLWVGGHDGCACLVAIRSGTSILFCLSVIHSFIDRLGYTCVAHWGSGWLVTRSEIEPKSSLFPPSRWVAFKACSRKKTRPNGVTVRVPQMDYYTVVLTLKGHIIWLRENGFIRIVIKAGVV